MKFLGKDLPDWLQEKLIREHGTDLNINHMVLILLEDYIERNGPCVHKSTALRDEWHTEYKMSRRVRRCLQCHEKVK